jgi:HSP20 family protein
MTKQIYEYIFEELENIRDYMDSLFQQIQETSPIVLLPPSHEPDRKLLPGVQDNLKVTVVEYDKEIVVTAEMIPGDLINDIKIDLIRSRALKISCIRREWKKEEKMEYCMCEHNYGYISQIIPLPAFVNEKGSNAQYKDGVLEVHLKKSQKFTCETISIEKFLLI